MLDRIRSLAAPRNFSLAIALATLAFGIATLHQYGVTTDSPSLLFNGDRTLWWMFHPGDTSALNLEAGNPPRFGSAFFLYPNEKDGDHYPVLPGIACAITSSVFHDGLHILDVVDGHHLGLVLLRALSLFLFGIYSSRLLGPRGGLLSTLCLALIPCAIGQSQNNPKDWPVAEFYAVAVLAIAVGVLEARGRTLALGGVLLGVALGCKGNAAFVLPTIALWLPMAWATTYFRRRPIPPAVAAGLLGIPYLALTVFFFSWPWLLNGPPVQKWLHVAEYGRYLVEAGIGPRESFTAFPFFLVSVKTPLAILFPALVFLAIGWRGGRERIASWSLVALWLLIPMGRMCLPKSVFFDSNRHFLEYVPALCAAAGAGVDSVWRFASQRQLRPAIASAFIAVWVATLAWPVIQYHPFETTFFNSLAGGLGKAQREGHFALMPPADVRINGTEGDYWFTSSRLAMRDLSKILPAEDAAVSVCGPQRNLARLNWTATENPARMVESMEKDFDEHYVYAAPRETCCWWWRVRELERTRPIVKRVERDGGLIYEILGPVDGKVREPVSPETWYERHPHPRDNDGRARYRTRFGKEPVP